VKIQSISASAQEFTGLCGNDLRLRRLKLDMIGRLGRFWNSVIWLATLERVEK